MMSTKKYTEEIFKLYDALRGVFFSKNIGLSVIRLIFIKYAIDNCLGAYTREEMQEYVKVQKVLAARDIEVGPDSLISVLDMIDKHYNLPGLMRNRVDDYARELFGLDESWNKKNVSTRNFEDIMSILANMDLMDNLETFEKGKELALALVDNLKYHGENVRFSAQYYSRREIGEIAKRILNVEENETFLDFVAGIGTTTISIVENEKTNIHLIDINEECLSASAMLLIMSGLNNFSVECKDIFDDSVEELCKSDIFSLEHNSLIEHRADKIFADPPIGMKIKNNPLRDSSVISLKKTLASLKNDGLAVVTAPASVLFSSLTKTREFRRFMLENKYVHAVISLPITYIGTTITANLVVLSKAPSEKVLFVNGCNSNYVSTVKESRYRGGNLITEHGIDTIVKAINERSDIEGFSRNVSIEELGDNEYDLMPSIYVTEPIVRDDISLEQIDEELQTLYNQLDRLRD